MAAASAVVVVLVAICVTAAGAFYWESLVPAEVPLTEDTSRKIRWRVRLFARKATGRVPDLSWAELWQMARHRGGFALEKLAYGRSAEGSVENPHISPEDKIGRASCR